MLENLKKLNQLIEDTINRLKTCEELNQNTKKLDDLQEIQKSLALLYNERGFLYYKSVEFNLAADDYTTALKIDPTLAVAFYNRGTIHYRMNNFEKAFNDMKAALDLDPNNPEFGLALKQSFQQMSNG